jgi:hypothetical protein
MPPAPPPTKPLSPSEFEALLAREREIGQIAAKEEDVAKRYVCGVCGGELRVMAPPGQRERRAICWRHWDHRGLREKDTALAAYFSGGAMHPNVENQVEKRLGLPPGSRGAITRQIYQAKGDDNMVEQALVKRESAKPAVIRPKVSAGEFMPALSEWNQMVEMGKVLAQSGMFPGVKEFAQAVAKMAYGRSLGLSALYSLKAIHTIPATERRPASMMLGA